MTARATLLESPPEHQMGAAPVPGDPAQRTDLEQRLFALVEEAAQWEPVEDGEPSALFVAIHARP